MRHALSPLLVCALLAGCDGASLGPDTPNQPGTPATAPQTGTFPQPQAGTLPDTGGIAVDFTQVSKQNGAAWADLAIAPDGALHAVYQDLGRDEATVEIYHRASTDGGASWGPETLLTAGNGAVEAGFCRVAADGQGRVYAVWKDEVDGPDGPEGGIASGTLVYKVLENGAWSDKVQLTDAKMARSFFPALAPDGRVYVVWSESMLLPDLEPAPPYESGLVRQARLDGATPADVRTDYESEPTMQDEGYGPITYYEGLSGLRGYVDAAGQAHWVAERIPPGDTAIPEDIVLFDGQALKPIFKIKDFHATNERMSADVPTLMLDAQGQEHLLIRTTQSESPALLDYSPPTAPQPTVILQLQHPEGKMFGFQAYQGPKGRLAALTQMHDTTDASDYPDLVLSVYDGAWAQSKNITNNAAREDSFSKDTTSATRTSQLTTYSAKFGAGAFDRGGRFNVLAVNTKITAILSEGQDWSGWGDAFGATGDTNVFFLRP